MFASHLLLPRAPALQYMRRGGPDLSRRQLAAVFGVSVQTVDLAANERWKAPDEYDEALLKLFRLDDIEWE